MRQFFCCFPNRHTLCAELSWSHYRILMKIADKTARDFYTEECTKSAWSVRQLERQINTMYYQRLLASKDKSSVAAEIQTSTPKPEYEKAIKDPYIMEFLQIKPDPHVYESDNEQALIDHPEERAVVVQFFDAMVNHDVEAFRAVTIEEEFIHSFGIRDTRGDVYLSLEEAEKQGLLTQTKDDEYWANYAIECMEWQYSNLVEWFGKDFYNNMELTLSEGYHPWQSNGEAYSIGIKFSDNEVETNYDGYDCIVSNFRMSVYKHEDGKWYTWEGLNWDYFEENPMPEGD